VIPTRELGPAAGGFGLVMPERYGAGAIPTTPHPSTYRPAQPAVALSHLEAANQGRDPGSMATAPNPGPNDVTFGGARNLSGGLSPGGLAAAKMGVSIAGRALGPAGAIAAGLVNLGLSLFGGRLGVASPAQVTAPDAPLTLPDGVTFSDPVTGVPTISDPLTGTIPDIAQPAVAPDVALATAPDPVSAIDTVAGPTDLTTGATQDLNASGDVGASSADAKAGGGVGGGDPGAGGDPSSSGNDAASGGDAGGQDAGGNALQ
jgi:hypothetical protein